jgi:hypothetical protein
VTPTGDSAEVPEQPCTTCFASRADCTHNGTKVRRRIAVCESLRRNSDPGSGDPIRPQSQKCTRPRRRNSFDVHYLHTLQRCQCFPRNSSRSCQVCARARGQSGSARNRTPYFNPKISAVDSIDARSYCIWNLRKLWFLLVAFQSAICYVHLWTISQACFGGRRRFADTQSFNVRWPSATRPRHGASIPDTAPTPGPTGPAFTTAIC